MVTSICMHELMFQSLLCWMWFGKITSAIYQMQSASVSILIVLDVVREDLHSVIVSILIYCFNPYCVGCGSGRRTIRSISTVYTLFQSLLCWMWFGKIMSLRDSIRLHIQFQSLLCWMWFGKIVALQHSFHRLHVSILIVLDVVREDDIVVLHMLYYKFQSLLCWMWFGKQL